MTNTCVLRSINCHRACVSQFHLLLPPLPLCQKYQLPPCLRVPIHLLLAVSLSVSQGYQLPPCLCVPVSPIAGRFSVSARGINCHRACVSQFTYCWPFLSVSQGYQLPPCLCVPVSPIAGRFSLSRRGINCHRAGVPGVYADVVKLMPWIRSVLDSLSGAAPY